ncbi:MAG: hypothetical protein DHS20C21_04950 [Gemmatimonadota bacterium]|nr:MAG: hypothetical protein DHS20C21_04950 [Gemmatimonadota bacterium]
MWTDYAIGATAGIGLLVGWVLVQAAWTRAFPGGNEPDALARRGGCRHCSCHGTSSCEQEEESR